VPDTKGRAASMDRKRVTATIDLSRFDAPGGASGSAARAAASRAVCDSAQPPLPRGGPGAHPAETDLAFAQVYDDHFDFVWRSLRLLGVDDHALEDATQDTFSVVSRQLAGFEGRSALKTWLFAILQRVAANYRRQRRRKQAPLTSLADAPSQDATPQAHAEAAEAARAIESFCATLPPERRALFVLAVLEDLPATEVAASLGLPIAKVYSRVHALRESLKRALAAQGARGG
jgi:RNA polymerase sigma-70 factor, ECF subfamily